MWALVLGHGSVVVGSAPIVGPILHAVRSLYRVSHVLIVMRVLP